MFVMWPDYFTFTILAIYMDISKMDCWTWGWKLQALLEKRENASE